MTFAVVGHNESETIAVAARQVLAAAGPDDATVFVDSASTDDSAARAHAAGLAVWPAPLGKGAAMREALAQSPHDWVVFLDADIFGSERNLALELAGVARQHPDAGMVVGDFRDRHPGGVLSNTIGVYEPLTHALFPEVAGRCGSKPLTGFRALRRSALAELGRLPGDFGIESWLNLEVGTGPLGLQVADLGWYEGRFLYKPEMGTEIGRACLDAAEAFGRLDRAGRPAWDAWVAEVVSVVAAYDGSEAARASYVGRLDEVRSRPLPPSRAATQHNGPS
jgi:glycosyltransferase involved in cell wall biosynthesis